VDSGDGGMGVRVWSGGRCADHGGAWSTTRSPEVLGHDRLANGEKEA
jgi:hypothetical protein